MTQRQEDIPRAYVLSIWAVAKAGHAKEWANTQHIIMPGTLMFQTQWIYSNFLKLRTQCIQKERTLEEKSWTEHPWNIHSREEY